VSFLCEKIKIKINPVLSIVIYYFSLGVSRDFVSDCRADWHSNERLVGIIGCLAWRGNKVN
jgi:hypothetical protein